MDRLNVPYFFSILKVLPAVQEEVESQILVSHSFKGEQIIENLVTLTYAEPHCSLLFFLSCSISVLLVWVVRVSEHSAE